MYIDNKLRSEIDRMVDLLKHIESKLVGFSDYDTQSFKLEIVNRNEAESISKSMKSNVIIMLYNLVESSIRTTMYFYYDSFNKKKYTYSETIVELKKLWIQYKTRSLKTSQSQEQIFEMIENSIDEEYSLALDFDKTFSLSGNADVQNMKKILEKHGLNYESNQFSDYGGTLRTIKDMRNNLAHGNVSFEDNGKELTVADLDKYKKQVYQCINCFIGIVKSSVE